MSETILYIEDNPDNRLLVRRILEAEGYVVIEATCGQEGLDFAAQPTQHPDLILMDINLPDMDGYEVTRRIRQMPHMTRTPIVAMTANVMQGDKEKTLEAGCNSYIQKPIDVDLLPKQIAAHL